MKRSHMSSRDFRRRLPVIQSKPHGDLLLICNVAHKQRPRESLRCTKSRLWSIRQTLEKDIGVKRRILHRHRRRFCPINLMLMMMVVVVVTKRGLGKRQRHSGSTSDDTRRAGRQLALCLRLGILAIRLGQQTGRLGTTTEYAHSSQPTLLIRKVHVFVDNGRRRVFEEGRGGGGARTEVVGWLLLGWEGDVWRG